MELNEIREKIDSIDREILKALNSRMELSLRTKRFKKGVRDVKREEEILDRLKRNRGSFPALRGEFIDRLFALILAESRKIQEESWKLIGKN